MATDTLRDIARFLHGPDSLWSRSQTLYATTRNRRIVGGEVMTAQEARIAARDIRACLMDVRVNLVRTAWDGVYTLRVWDMAMGTTLDLNTLASVEAYIAETLSDNVGLE